MRQPTPEIIKAFIDELGRQCDFPAEIFIFGGSALILIGSPRSTIDIDYTLGTQTAHTDLLRQTIKRVSGEMNLDVDESIPSEFMPLPPGAAARHQIVFTSGQVKAYIFDVYSIALSKLERGFKSDIEDVLFLIHHQHIALDKLEQYLNVVINGSEEPQQLRANFNRIAGRG
ncbi:MAG TPA: DUF6036 family nucleotidyltransferase [Anaerolineae bacterium]|jgi:hypothetical protein